MFLDRLLFLFVFLSAYLHGEIKREFGKIPYTLEISGNKETGLQLKCFDPKDPEFGPEGVPFLTMEIKEEAELLELGKTTHFSGRAIVALAKELQVEFGAKALNLTDTSYTLPCERDGKWCRDEALMDLCMTSIFIEGKSYYQVLGATAQDKGFDEAARFIYELPLFNFILELSQIPQADSMVTLVKEIGLALQLDIQTLTLGNLAKSLYGASKENEYAHQLWHRFHDHFIAEKEGLIIPYLLQKRTIDPELLDIVKSEIDLFIQSGVDVEEEQINFTDIRLQLQNDKLNQFSHSPALFRQSRASQQCLRNTADVNGVVKNHPRLLSLYQLERRENGSKSLIDLWFLAKHKIRKTKRFTLIN